MKIEADWLNAPAPRAVMAMLTDGGHRVYYVGGTVRNALFGLPPGDIDISTDARPEQVMELAGAAGLKALPTGIDHGTVTVVTNHTGIEVTTFRRDVETDGRRAVVEFSDKIEDDAARRDFTMNALYAEADGTVIDPLGGLYDLQARRIRFVGDPIDRIREDYLRILRFFRFYAHYGHADEGLDPDGLAACAMLSEGLEKVSRERIGTEVLKLLTAVNPAPSVAAMETSGVLAHVLPGTTSRVLPRLLHMEDAYPIEGRMPAPWDSIARLASLGGEEVPKRLRLSKAQAQKHELMVHEAGLATPPGELGYRHGYWTAAHALMLRWAVLEQPFDEAALEDIRRGAEAKFPLRAADLMPAYEGPALGARMKELEAKWIASGFALSREALLR